jgi:hypothetical protein
MDADSLWRAARDLRDELDFAGVKLREEERLRARSLTHFPLREGGGRVIATLDTENYAKFVDLYDRMTSPKRGGVRFVNPVTADRARRIADDDRTPAQLALDGLMQLLEAGADADDSVLLGSGAPVVRVTVAATSLERGLGIARIDGRPEAISLQTAQRLLCGGTEVRLAFDPNGTHIEQGEDHRLFSKRQREVLAAKFGGCMHPGCERPPSWCEAHHILQWVRDGGKTVIENGILLCKYHHLKYHNDGYEIVRDEFGRYWLVPPRSIDAMQSPVEMPRKTRNLNDLFAAAG